MKVALVTSIMMSQATHVNVHRASHQENVAKNESQQQTNGVKMDNKIEKETFEVELFIHAGGFNDDFTVLTTDFSSHGYILLGTQTVTLNVPTRDPVEAQIEMLDKKEASLVKEHLAQLHAIQQRKKDLLCLEVKDG